MIIKAYLGENGTFSLMRNLNLEKVFKLILLRQPTTRVEIVGLSGINRNTVSHCVNFLINKEIVRELPVEGKDRGRPPIMLFLNKDCGVYIGIEINLISTLILVTDILGNSLEEKVILGEDIYNPQKFLRMLAEYINELNKKYSYMRYGVIAVGIALQGIYNEKLDIMEYNVRLHKWNGLDIKQEIRKYMVKGIELFITTAAEARATGEMFFGKSRPSEDLAFINGSWGISLAINSGNIFYKGSKGFAGRFGHIIVDINGRKCVCGNNGCLEAYASVGALIRKLYQKETFNYNYINQMLERIKNKEPQMMEALYEMSEYLAIGIINIVNAYNPGQICIGGYLGMFIDDDQLSLIRKKVEESTLPCFNKDLEIYCSDLGEFGAAKGCISTARNHIIEFIVKDDK